MSLATGNSFFSALQGSRSSSTRFSSGGSSSSNFGQTQVNRVSSVNRASNTAREGGLVQRIIVTLTPTIRDAVSTALAGNTVSRESFTSSYVTATQSINREDVAMKVMDALEPTIAAQVARAIESMRSTQVYVFLLYSCELKLSVSRLLSSAPRSQCPSLRRSRWSSRSSSP